MAKVFQKCKDDPRSPLYPCGIKRCGHNWTVRYREPGGRTAKQREKTFPRWKDANDYGIKTENDKREQIYVDPSRGRITVRALAEDRMSAFPNLRITTVKRLNSFYGNWLFPVMGDKRLTGVTSNDVQTVVNRMNDSLSAISVQTNYLDIASLFNYAVKHKRIPETPCQSIVLPEVAVSAVDPRKLPSFEEVGRMAELMCDDAVFVWLAFGLGLRLGEAIGLTTDDIAEDRIRLQHQIGEYRGSAFAPLKHRRPGEAREIPMPAFVRDKINAHIERHGTWQLEGRELLFAPIKGRATYIDVPAMSARWKHRVKVKGGMPYTPHVLRHLFASTALADNVPIHEVSRWLGHKSIQMTVDTYGHLTPWANERCRASLQSALERC